MAEERSSQARGQEILTPRGYRFVTIWAAALLLGYALGGYFGAVKLRGYSAATEEDRRARFEPPIDSNARTPGIAAPAGPTPTDVLVGISIRRIGEFALKESAWIADFNIWFRWSGGPLRPGEGFRLVDGQIMQREKVESSKSGQDNYEAYHVVARMVKTFDALRYPFGDQWLVVVVEDPTNDIKTLRYVPDDRNSEIRTGAMPPNVRLTRSVVSVTSRSSNLGRQSGAAVGSAVVHSQFYFAMLGRPVALGLYQKMFQALFASLAVAMIALFIKPEFLDPRFGIPVGAFFAGVSNNVFVSELLPPADRLTLADMVNTVSLATIFFVLLESAISLYISDRGHPRLARLLDRVSAVALLAGCLAVNLTLPLAASPS